VLLAALHVLGPVAGVGALVVEQAADTELLSGRAVPACPVARAGRLVAEDAIQGSAVLGLDGGIGYLLVPAVVAPPGVVAAVSDAAVATHEDQAVGAVVELRRVGDTLPVPVAVRRVPHHARLDGARVHLVVADALGCPKSYVDGERYQ